MSYEYELNYGSYYLYDTNKPVNSITKERDIILMCDSIAIAFDSESGTLHKHGRPEQVTQWYNTARNKFISAGFDDMANSLILIEGTFPVEEVNKCISCSGYISVFYKKLQDNQILSAKPSL